jgi:NitT/TauT family transport system ATP-binding protein
MDVNMMIDATTHLEPLGAGATEQPMPLLRVERVSKSFRQSESTLHALQNISFSVAPREVVTLVGPSGSGKSTLLRLLAGLTQPDSGSVWLDGEIVTSPHPAVGMVFQRTNLMPWRTVLDNVLLPAEVQRGRVSDEDRRLAERLLKLVNLTGFEQTYPRQLSGGMAQRVVLARALFQSPRLLLLDEPFGALDALTRERMNVELLRVQEMAHQTIVAVTHSISEAVFLSDRVIVLSDRPGRVVAQVPVDLPRPRTLELMGSEHFARLTGEVRRHLG